MRSSTLLLGCIRATLLRSAHSGLQILRLKMPLPATGLGRLGLILNCSYGIAEAVLSHLTASECALVGMLVGYELGPAQAQRFLHPLRDMPLLEKEVERLRGRGIGLAVVGSDVESLIHRISVPSRYWAGRRTLEGLQVWLVPFKRTVGMTCVASRNPSAIADVSAAEFANAIVPRDGRWHNLHATDRGDLSVWASAGDFYSDDTSFASFICNTQYYQGAFNSAEVETSPSYLGSEGCEACLCERVQTTECAEHSCTAHGPCLSAVDGAGRGYTCVADLTTGTCESRRELKHSGDIDGAVVLEVLHDGLSAGPLAKAHTGTYYINLRHQEVPRNGVATHTQVQLLPYHGAGKSTPRRGRTE